jgi:hypothetical protein
MIPNRKKPGVAFWATVVVVVVLVAYPLSFVPACWLVKRGTVPIRPAAIFYRPVVSLVLDGPDCVQEWVTLNDPTTQVVIYKMRLVLDPSPPATF